MIGYAVSTRLDTSLTLKALKSHGFLVSMARAGNPYENARMESFFKTLKCEEVSFRGRM